MRTSDARSKHILTPQERRRRNREEMTATILDAARAIMREEGVAALNLHEVARRVGMKTPSLYEYFPSKAAIYDELFRLGIRLSAERARALDDYDPTWQAVEAAMRFFLEFALEYPELYQLCYERHVPHWEPSENAMRESWDALAAQSRRLQAWIDSGLIRADVPAEQVRDLIIVLLYGLTAQHLANEPHLPAGSGRFGALIPAAVGLLRAAWGAQPDEATPTRPLRRKTRKGKVKES